MILVQWSTSTLTADVGRSSSVLAHFRSRVPQRSNRPGDRPDDEFSSCRWSASGGAAWMDVQILRVDKRAWCVTKPAPLVPAGGLGTSRRVSALSKVAPLAADADNSRPLRSPTLLESHVAG